VPGLSRLVHLTVALMLLALLLKAGTSSLQLRTDPIPWLFWVFFLLAFASVLWSQHSSPALVRSIGLLTDVLGATLLWVALWNGLSLKWIVWCAGLGAAVQAVTALNQFWSGIPQRAGGLGDSPNVLAVQLSLTAFLIFVGAGRSWLAGAGALTLIVIATVTSGSRKMIFVWLTYLLLFSKWLTLGLKRSTVVAAATLLLLPASVFALIENSESWLAPVTDLIVYERLEMAILGEESSANVRGSLIGDALERWTEAPLFGHGIDQFRWLNEFRLYSHSNYTELLANFGIVGLLLYYAIHLNLLWRAANQARAGSARSWLIVLFIFMLMLMDMARVSYQDRLTWALFSILAFLCETEAVTLRRSSAAGGTVVSSAD
jgi:O-antigen ligase